MGDFNEVLAATEHSRCLDYMLSQLGMRNFQTTRTYCGLKDLSFIGALYTWTNNRENNPIGKKLDRVFGNEAWSDMFVNSYATFEAGGVSDHSQMSLHLHKSPSTNRKPFKFFNHARSHPQFSEHITEVWSQTPRLFHSRLALVLFQKKLKSLKQVLQELNRTCYGDISLKVKTASEDLVIVQEAAFAAPSHSAVTAVSNASARWTYLSTIEEQFYKRDLESAI